MRNTVKFNRDWFFSKSGIVPAAMPEGWDEISLPHTWNAQDGQDGGNDYFRGVCCYTKSFSKPEISEAEEVWLEFRGAAMTATAFLNGHKLCVHQGGYSTFRVELTPYLQEKNLLAVLTDNSANREVYPQRADFTFYGGIYRDVYLITVPRTHFALDHHGDQGIILIPIKNQEEWQICLSSRISGETETAQVRLTLLGDDQTQSQVFPVQNGKAEGRITVDHPHLWNGKKDPFLYTVQAELLVDGDIADTVETRIGLRTFRVDPEKGFILNDVPLRLCGAARHQDRKGLGSALTEKEHREDMALMLEMGVNTVRLAHYQHDQLFYDLCDEAGLIVWAEIPYITEHMSEGNENTIQQMTELIMQNRHHASIICWGLSNEITVTGGVSADLVENHRRLNDLCHRMDPTRLTTMAHAFVLDTEDPLVFLPDIRSFNLYYGWYVGDLADNDTFFDEFHRKHPDQAIGLSEYGADALITAQSGKPRKGDYTEGYQTLYHEHMLKMWEERPYIWAMHVWNMFDFAADGRSDGGDPGVNHKGLVSFDRRVKKDAYYLYKAYLTEKPFIHLCGKRYEDRAEEETEIKVYSNLSEISLLVDGKLAGKQQGKRVFTFRVPISDEHVVMAVSGECSDRMTIRKVTEPNPAYSLTDTKVVNWFDSEWSAPEGFFSVHDRIAEIGAHSEAAKVLAMMSQKSIEAYGDVARNATVPEAMKQRMAQMTMLEQMEMAGNLFHYEDIERYNHILNQIRKEDTP